MIKPFLLSIVMLLLCASPLRAAEDLCPDVEKARAATPGDMAGVQADIERLSLCVERARLLKQLDDIAVQRQKMLDDTKNPGATVTGNISVNPDAIPPLPVSALPPLKNDAPLKSGETRVKNAASSPLDGIGDTVKSLAAPSWNVRKIWGQGAGMRAQLSDGRGTLVNIVKGDPLPDGAIVETISVKGVAVSQGGKVKDLSWEQAKGGGNNAAPAP